MQGTYSQDTSELSSLEVEHDVAEPWLVGYIVTHFRQIDPRKGSGFNSQAPIPSSHQFEANKTSCAGLPS